MFSVSNSSLSHVTDVLGFFSIDNKPCKDKIFFFLERERVLPFITLIGFYAAHGNGTESTAEECAPNLIELINFPYIKRCCPTLLLSKRNISLHHKSAHVCRQRQDRRNRCLCHQNIQILSWRCLM